MKVHAPGKLILSGEHAVVYGHPALTMAVNRYAVATASPQRLPLISFDLSDFSYERGLTLTALNRLKSRIKQKYQRFMSGDFKIRDVLQKPVELAQFAFSLFLETLNLTLTQGIRVHLQSSIPIGCGMGSSAATVLSVVHAIANHLQVELSAESFFQLGLKAENMQHGYSSGLDVRVSLHGGCILVDNGQVYSRQIPTVPMYLVNTGIPITSTGECVVHAASHFKTNAIGNTFTEVTHGLDRALQANHLIDVMRFIRENHRLLTHIGIVPQRVQRFIREIEQMQSAAKICGAGSVAGEKAGVVLIVTEDKAALEKVCERYQYPILPIAGEARGVHVV